MYFTIMKKVIVYTSDVCPYCIMVKNFLKQNNVEFGEVNVSRNREKAEEIAKKSGARSVPVTEIDGEIVVGYDTKRLKELLGL